MAPDHVHGEVARQGLVAALERDQAADAASREGKLPRAPGAVTRAKRRTAMFSPIFAISARRSSSSVSEPWRNLQQRLDGHRGMRQRRLRELASECLELIAARDEISLAIDLDHARRFGAGALDRERAFGRDARGLLVGFG